MLFECLGVLGYGDRAFLPPHSTGLMSPSLHWTHVVAPIINVQLRHYVIAVNAAAAGGGGGCGGGRRWEVGGGGWKWMKMMWEV
jgi:hypothetical protein